MTEKQRKQVITEFLQKQIELTSVILDEALRTSPMNISEINQYTNILLGQHVTINNLSNEKKQESKPRTEA
jgi:hypothetical protein